MNAFLKLLDKYLENFEIRDGYNENWLMYGFAICSTTIVLISISLTFTLESDKMKITVQAHKSLQNATCEEPKMPDMLQKFCQFLKTHSEKWAEVEEREKNFPIPAFKWTLIWIWLCFSHLALFAPRTAITIMIFYLNVALVAFLGHQEREKIFSQYVQLGFIKQESFKTFF